MMRTGSIFGEDATRIEHCPVRATCPVGALCGRGRGEGAAPLFPTLEEIARDDIAWTDLRYEQRVHVFRRGVFALFPNFEAEGDIVLSLLGAGYTVGLAELYVPRAVAGTYHLRALTEGEICSFPAKAFKRHLEALPVAESNAILACALTNMTEASCAQLRTVSRTSLYDRIVFFLLRCHELGVRQGVELREVNATHEEVASLVASDRASVTRALRKLKEDGLVELGYKSIRMTGALLDRSGACPDVHVNFQSVRRA